VVTTNATLMLPARHSSAQASSVITITGIGDHDQPDWLITMTGIRTPWCYDMDPLSHANARLLDADLFALNGATSQIADLSTCVRLPVIGSPGAFVGCVYVIEGAGRGGRVMAQRLGALLGAGVTEGRRFFLGCPVADTSPWLRCCIAVERGAADGHIDAMIAVAVDTFGALENWLQERTEIA
jgi:heme oxygenase